MDYKNKIKLYIFHHQSSPKNLISTHSSSPYTLITKKKNNPDINNNDCTGHHRFPIHPNVVFRTHASKQSRDTPVLCTVTLIKNVTSSSSSRQPESTARSWSPRVCRLRSEKGRSILPIFAPRNEPLPPPDRYRAFSPRVKRRGGKEEEIGHPRERWYTRRH